MAEIAPARSKTDPVTPEQHQRSARPHIPRRLHANSFRSKGQFGSSTHNNRHAAKNTVQSAIELKPPINFEHLLRRQKNSPDSSRQGSANATQQQLDSTSGAHAKPVEGKVRPEDIAKAKKDNVKREEELRASLKSVEDVGMNSTQQLDDTYYAILEKASILRSTVSSLQHLAEETRRMHSSFQEDTTKLQQDTKQSLDSWGNFEQQETSINALVNKLQSSKERTNHLNDRLESARLRVEAYEQHENAKQATRRTRWRIVWITLLSVFVLMVAVLLARHRRRVGLDLDSVQGNLVRIADLVDDVRSRPSPTSDPLLGKLFDGL